MARYPFQGTSKDGGGKIICSATVAVFLAGTSTPASIYAASAGGSAVNSVTSGADTSSAPGYFIFYVDRADYAFSQLFDVTISKSGFNTQTYPSISIGVTSHKTTHQDGGVDEISVTGLSGLLADDQHVLDSEVLAVAAALAHKTRHEDAGADEISVAALSGLLADPQTPLISFFQKAKSYRNAAQTIPAATWTRVDMDTDTYDPNNITELIDSGNSRIVPTKAGYYQVNGEVAIAQGATTMEVIVAIYKNGTGSARGGRIYIAGAAGTISSVSVSDVIYCDGSTDYLELYCLVGAEKNLEIVAHACNYLSVVGPF